MPRSALWSMLAVVVTLAALTGAGCSPLTPKCSATTCAGCCDSLGACQLGNTALACGGPAFTCAVCTVGQMCNLGFCIAGGVGGGSGGSGGGGGTNTACGPGTNNPCSGGCCVGSACVPSATQSNSACGHFGAACATCTVGSTCSNGACVGGGTGGGSAGCGPASCPSGCCVNGTCVPQGSQNVNVCGNFGGTCGQCSGTQVCSAGSCQPSGCNASTCSGCCNGPVCVPQSGQGSASCGGFGNACIHCLAGQICSAGACQVNNGCNQNTCPSGCCNGSVCVPQSAQTLASCGSFGDACSPCNAGQTCSAGTCGAPAVTVGDPCTTDTQCSSLGGNFKCKKTTSSGNGIYKNGYCTKLCTAAADCPSATSACVTIGPAYGEADSLCWKNCSSLADCQGGDGYDCYAVTGGSGTSNACWISPIPPIDAGTPSNKIGNPCTLNTQCINPPDPAYGFCLTETFDGGPTGFVGGECVANCTSTGQAVCGANGLCLSGYLASSDVCVPTCTTAWVGRSNCRAGYVCTGYVSGDGGESVDGFCEPSCFNSGSGCSAGYCDAGYCLN